MTDFEKVCNFGNLLEGHLKARRGKRTKREVIEFEMDLAKNLAELSDALCSGTYRLSAYCCFLVHEPKKRTIHALCYRDRVVQRCVCDQVLAPLLDNRLIYDNAACRAGKGTHFALRRLTRFFKEHHQHHGTDGYALKCDIRKFFDFVMHDVLKEKLRRAVADDGVYDLLCRVIDSYSAAQGRGLPLGNQTSQWFALLYLDSLDRLVKEKLRIRHYSRYMDDCVLLHHDKDYLRHCLEAMTRHLRDCLGMEFNEKTQIFPLKNGVDYLGWHFYLADEGKIIRRLRPSAKVKFKRKLQYLRRGYERGVIDTAKISLTVASCCAHLMHGHTRRLRAYALENFILK